VTFAAGGAGRTYEVIVIGGGPVGLSMAHLLGRAGISTLLVERNSGTSRHPRASGIHGRTMELFRQWGVAGQIRAFGLPPERAQGFGWMTRLNGLELGRLMFADGPPPPPKAKEVTPEHPCFCPQLAYEPVLLREAAAHPSVTIEFDRAAEAIDQDDSRVVVGVRDLKTGRVDGVSASYVVAADGAASSTRASLGISETATERFGHSINVYFRAALAPYVADRPFMLFWIVNGETQGTLGAASPDHTLWTYNFDGDRRAEYPDEALVAQVRQAVGAEDLEVEVLEVLRWDYDQAVTDEWRLGRVLLVGDAAHRFPPHGAFGMNSGVQDANNLAWKLISVLRGAAAPGLLDTYQAERKPVAELNSSQALSNTKTLAETGWHGPYRDELATIELPAEGRELRERIGAAVAKQRDHLHSEGQQFGTIYRSDAVFPDGAEAPESTISEYRETGAPGARAPHLWLRNAAGERLSTVDLWAGEFVLLAGEGGPGWLAAASTVSNVLGVPVTPYQIGRDLMTEEVNGFGDTYGVSPDGAVLVRPDGHVAARFDTAPSDEGAALDQALSQILHVRAHVAS
jgi:putative polyketide hydroxylase